MRYFIVSLGNSSRSTTPAAACFSPSSISPRVIQSPITVGPKANVFMPISHPGLHINGRTWPVQDQASRQPIPLAGTRQAIIRCATIVFKCYDSFLCYKKPAVCARRFLNSAFATTVFSDFDIAFFGRGIIRIVIKSFYLSRPELLRPVGKIPANGTSVAAAVGTSVIHTSSNYSHIPCSSPLSEMHHNISHPNMNPPPGALCKRDSPSDTVIQNGRSSVTSLNKEIVPHPQTPNRSIDVSRKIALGSAVEKNPQTSISLKSETARPPQNLSRFCIEKLGFSNGNASGADMKMEEAEDVIVGGPEGELVQLGSSVTLKLEGVQDPSIIGNKIETDLGTSATKTFPRTQPGTLILAAAAPSTGAGNQVGHCLGVHVVTSGVEGHSANAVRETWSEIDERPVYHWSQLVPLITAASPPNPKTETQASLGSDTGETSKPATVAVPSGPAPPQAALGADCGSLEGANERRESVGGGQESEGELATDDDDVFVPDGDASLMESNKRRTQSLGALPMKEEPKSPRKVSDASWASDDFFFSEKCRTLITTSFSFLKDQMG